MFVSFRSDITVTMGMLKQMYGVGSDGVSKTDKLLDFSSALSLQSILYPVWMHCRKWVFRQRILTKVTT